MPRKKPENLKTKKERKRYVLFFVESAESKTNAALFSKIQEHVRQKLGEEFLQKASLKLIEFDGKFGILKCERSSKDSLVEALRKVPGKSNKLTIKTLSASGTLRALRRKKERLEKELKF